MRGQAVVVHMRMRDHDAVQAVVRLPEPRNLGEQRFLRFVGRVERQADIEHEALAPGLCFDAGAA